MHNHKIKFVIFWLLTSLWWSSQLSIHGKIDPGGYLARHNPYRNQLLLKGIRAMGKWVVLLLLSLLMKIKFSLERQAPVHNYYAGAYSDYSCNLLYTHILPYPYLLQCLKQFICLKPWSHSFSVQRVKSACTYQCGRWYKHLNSEIFQTL